MGSEASRKVILFTGVKLQREFLWALLAGISIAPMLPLSNFVGHSSLLPQPLQNRGMLYGYRG